MWIKTSERLPELSNQSIEPGTRRSRLVLTFTPIFGRSESDIGLARLVSRDHDELGWEIDGDEWDIDEVQFWCPIPELPGE